jgi:AraC family transcriptional regulator
VTLGEVETATEIPGNKLEHLRNNLDAVGFELLDNSKQQLIEKIKTVIIKQVHYSEEEQQHNLSDILSKALHKDYSYQAAFFRKWRISRLKNT